MPSARGVFIEFCDILLNIPLFPPFLRGTFDARFINRTQVNKQLYQIPQKTKAPGVRHIRSPKPLRSGGLGLRESTKFGSAVGAAYPHPCNTTISSLTINYWIWFRRICSNFMIVVEFRLRMMSHLLFCHMALLFHSGLFIPHGNAAHSHMPTDIPPRNRADFTPE